MEYDSGQMTFRTIYNNKSFHRFPSRSTSSASKNDDHLASKSESDDGIHTLTLGAR